MDCFGTYFTHAQSCDNVHVQSATGRTAFGTYTCPKPVITFMFKVLRTGLLQVHTLHMPKAVIKFVFEVYGMDCWRTYLTHAQICDNIRVQSATEWIVFSPFSRFRFFPFPCLAFSRFRVPPAASPGPGHRFRVHRYQMTLEKKKHGRPVGPKAPVTSDVPRCVRPSEARHACGIRIVAATRRGPGSRVERRGWSHSSQMSMGLHYIYP